MSLSALAVQTLMQLPRVALHAQPSVLAFVLATAAFLLASVGAFLVALGRHIFDRVEVSARFAQYNGDRARTSRPVPGGLQDELSVLTVGRDASGEKHRDEEGPFALATSGASRSINP